MKFENKISAISLFLVPLIWCLASHYNVLNSIKNTAMDWRFLLRGQRELPVDAKGNRVRVIHIDFDSKTLPIVGERPWDRAFFSDVGKILLDPELGNAACIGFDFLFSSQSMSKMVPAENVLNSDQSIGSLLQQYPKRSVVAGFYSNIMNELYMDQVSRPPFRIKNNKPDPLFTDPKNNPYPETPSYPVINHLNGNPIGRIGMIDYDLIRSHGFIPRVSPAYFEYQGPAYALNLLTSRMQAHAVENNIEALLTESQSPKYIRDLILHGKENDAVIARLMKNGEYFEIVDSENNLLPISPNRLHAHREIIFYHMSIQLVLAYYGLDESNLKITENRDAIEMRDSDGTLLHSIPLEDEQVITINWFSKWNPNDLKPHEINPNQNKWIQSKINPRCSIKDVITNYAEIQRANARFIDLQFSPNQGFQKFENTLSKQIADSENSIQKMEELIEKTPSLEASIQHPVRMAKEKRSFASERLEAFNEAKEQYKNAKEFFSYFQDAILLVGPVDKLFQDLAPTPFDRFEVPKVGVHSNLVKTILSDEYIKKSPNELEYFLAFIFSALSIFLFSYKTKGNEFHNLLGIGIFLLYLGASLYLFVKDHSVLPLVVPMGVYISSGLIAFGETSYIEKRQKRRIKKLFGSYVSKELVEQIIEKEGEPILGGVDLEISALFSDIQAFSTFSEMLSSYQLVELMNEYLAAMTDILHEEQGTLDKYIGDAIVAMYGAPLKLQSHAYQSVKSAIRMQKMQVELREKWKSEGNKWPKIVTEMQTRIGINSGFATVGNIGAKDRFNYTMMGDMVNLAARCESGSKSLGAYTMITENCYQQAIHFKEDIVYRYLDKIVVKGRYEPMGMYEVIGFEDEISTQTQDCIGTYKSAYELYLEQKWDEAYKLFDLSLLNEPNHPVYNPSKVFMDRCLAMKELPLNDKWDGTFIMSSK